MKEQIEYEIQSDPTLRFLLRETKFDYGKIDHQVSVRKAAFMIALNRALKKVQ